MQFEKEEGGLTSARLNNWDRSRVRGGGFDRPGGGLQMQPFLLLEIDEEEEEASTSVHGG